MKLIYKEEQADGAFAESYAEVGESDLYKYIDSLFMSGYTAAGERYIGKNRFLDMRRGSDAVFLAYYKELAELRAVYEPSSKYFTYADEGKSGTHSCLLTQVDLIDYGMSYAVRLSDGRFIIFDGGWESHGDEDRLFSVLKAQSPHGVPGIALWVLTHQHIDHYRCFSVFVEKYGDKVNIEKLLYNFAEENPQCIARFDIEDGGGALDRFYEAAKSAGAVVYTAHTGQIYKVGDAVLEILASPDDSFYEPLENLNETSLVIKMTLAGQKILFSADSDFNSVKLKERWGSCLRSDILQVAHHGFPGGDSDTYDLIAPAVCLVPNDETIYFENSCIHREENKHIVYNMNIRDLFIGGSGDIALELPYKPRENGRELLAEMAARHRENVGECEQTASGKIKIENKTFFDVNVKVGSEKITLPYLNSAERDAGEGTLIISDYPVKVTKI